MVGGKQMTHYMEIRRPAREKDCAWCAEAYHGKRKIHKCTNPKSQYFNSQVTIKDTVCDQWEFIKEENK